MSLLERYRDVVSKHKDVRMKQEADADVQYPTGFPTFDFINGLRGARPRKILAGAESDRERQSRCPLPPRAFLA